MKLTKELILEALSKITLPNEGKSIVESGAIKNVQIFGTDVELDIESPAHVVNFFTHPLIKPALVPRNESTIDPIPIAISSWPFNPFPRHVF